MSQPQGVHARNADLTLVQRETGWEPRVETEASIEAIYAWVYDRLGD
jgi:nucleoside-diphosphate-sugar epimerase